jgi:hypothetical protein
MSVDRLRLSPVGETMFPPRTPFFRDLHSLRAAEIAANAVESKRGNRLVSPGAPSPAHGLEGSR